MAKKLKIWNGASWEDVTFAITPPTTNVTNSFTTNQVIDVSTSVAALRITQRGTGEALRVEDDTNPDSSPFVINASGNVGIGTASPNRKLKISGDSVSFGIQSTSSGGGELAIDPPSNNNGMAQIDVSGANTLRFNTNSVERFVIGSNGDFTLNAPNGRLFINSSRSVTGANWDHAMIQLTGTNEAGVNPGISWHAPGASAMSMWHPRGGQALQIMGNSGVVDTSSGQMTIRNIAISTSAPSAGNGANGDVWLVYTA